MKLKKFKFIILMEVKSEMYAPLDCRLGCLRLSDLYFWRRQRNPEGEEMAPKERGLGKIEKLTFHNSQFTIHKLLIFWLSFCL